MSDNRISVDIDALRRGGVQIDELGGLVRDISGQLASSITTNRDAGGPPTSEMGRSFANGYAPGAERALQFLDMLSGAIAETGFSTTGTARSFATTADEATEIANKAN